MYAFVYVCTHTNIHIHTVCVYTYVHTVCGYVDVCVENKRKSYNMVMSGWLSRFGQPWCRQTLDGKKKVIENNCGALDFCSLDIIVAGSGGWVLSTISCRGIKLYYCVTELCSYRKWRGAVLIQGSQFIANMPISAKSTHFTRIYAGAVSHHHTLFLSF